MSCNLSIALVRVEGNLHRLASVIRFSFSTLRNNDDLS
jgi:hypothetical protein